MTIDRALPPGSLRAHVAELLRLATPVMVSRTGFMMLVLVDTLMVGHYGSEDLAHLGLGTALVGPLLLIPLGLLMGTVVLAAAAKEGGKPVEAGLAWRRSLPQALALGLLGTAICALGEPLLRLSGQAPDLAAAGGAVMAIIGPGLPFVLLFITTAFFLEGIRRPGVVAGIMVAGNLLNLGLNWVLVYGHMGLPALGAEGSAWATTLVRAALAVMAVGYVLTMPDRREYGLDLRPRDLLRYPGPWRDGARQRRIGYAAGVGLGVEVVAFATLNLFAGWLGALPLAAFSIVMNLMTVVFMIAVGLGVATAVRVGGAHGRGDTAGVALAGWTGLAVNSVLMAACGVAFGVAPGILSSIYTADPALVAVAAPAVAFAGWILVADGGQGLLANALRGRLETWVPTAIQAVSYLAVMVPLCWALALFLDRGVRGLMEGMLVASLLSVGLLAWRFQLLVRRDQHMF
ncbi:MAG: MATE family efflux transporter [Rhodobacterales bacterium]|nr:MATE family efflux transporter [Rhodobacterales bacterium]